MTNDIKYSVILPTYNRADSYLKDAILSVINQKYVNWELLIIDNNSKDSTDELVKSFKNNKIRLLKNYNIGNIAQSRNIGIKKSKGEFIAFLDSDDFWTSEKLNICNKFLNYNKEIGICHAESWLYENGTKKIKIYGPEKNYEYKKLLIRGNCISLSAVILPKSFFYRVGFFSENPNFISAEDYDLWIRLSKNNLKIKFLNDNLGTFRMHDESISSNIVKHTKSINNVLLQYDYRNKSISRSWFTAGKRFQLAGYYLLACKFYIKALLIKLNRLGFE